MKDLETQTAHTLLQAPLVETAAPEDGLLPVGELDKPLAVTVMLWHQTSATHTCQLLWNGMPVGHCIPLQDDQAGEQLTLHMPTEQRLFTEGRHELQYRIRDTVGQHISDSPVTPIVIDRSPPGGELLAALSLPRIALDGLTPDKLTALHDQLTVRVPGYFDMQWGDVIETRWGEQPGPVRTVRIGEPGTDKVRISVDRAFLEQLGNGEFAVSYRVRDRAGNVSVHSQPVMLKLQLQPLPVHLSAPIALKIDKGQVHDLQARLGVKIAVPSYEHASAGDEIRLFWNGDQVGGKRLVSAHEQDKSLLLNVMVRYLCISRHGDGPVRVHYQVCRQGEVFTSPDLVLEVFLQLPGPQDPTPQTLVNEALAAPLIKGRNPHAQNLDNYLDEDNAQRPADVLIAWRNAFRAGDRINLFWGRSTQPLVHCITRQDVDSARHLVISVPNGLIVEQGCGVDIRVQYTVTREGNPNTAYAPQQSVAVIFRMQLPGGTQGLLEPVFSAASVLNVVDPRKDPEGTVVHVAPYRNMQVGDRIVLRFCGFDALAGGNAIERATFTAERVVVGRDLRYGCRFRVPLARLMAVEHGRGRAHYEVINSLGRVTSLPADVYISSRVPVTVR